MELNREPWEYNRCKNLQVHLLTNHLNGDLNTLENRTSKQHVAVESYLHGSNNKRIQLII